MTEKQLKATIKMIESGHVIRMYSGPYVNEFADVWQDSGTWMIKNNVLVERKLSDVPFDHLTFYKRVEIYVQ